MAERYRVVVEFASRLNNLRGTTRIGPCEADMTYLDVMEELASRQGVQVTQVALYNAKRVTEASQDNRIHSGPAFVPWRNGQVVDGAVQVELVGIIMPLVLPGLGKMGVQELKWILSNVYGMLDHKGASKEQLAADLRKLMLELAESRARASSSSSSAAAPTPAPAPLVAPPPVKKEPYKLNIRFKNIKGNPNGMIGFPDVGDWSVNRLKAEIEGVLKDAGVDAPREKLQLSLPDNLEARQGITSARGDWGENFLDCEILDLREFEAGVAVDNIAVDIAGPLTLGKEGERPSSPPFEMGGGAAAYLPSLEKLPWEELHFMLQTVYGLSVSFDNTNADMAAAIKAQIYRQAMERITAVRAANAESSSRNALLRRLRGEEPDDEQDGMTNSGHSSAAEEPEDKGGIIEALTHGTTAFDFLAAALDPDMTHLLAKYCDEETKKIDQQVLAQFDQDIAEDEEQQEQDEEQEPEEPSQQKRNPLTTRTSFWDSNKYWFGLKNSWSEGVLD